jgi:hypothetical protein
MDGWGEIRLTKIKESGDFWILMDELLAEYNQNCRNKKPEGFYCNRGSILDAYVEGKLYGLSVNETASMSRGDKIFAASKLGIIFKSGEQLQCNPEKRDIQSYSLNTEQLLFKINCLGGLSWYLLPCFCIVENEQGEMSTPMIWTAERARRKGFGTKMVKLAEITKISNHALDESIPFWKSLEIDCNQENK